MDDLFDVFAVFLVGLGVGFIIFNLTTQQMIEKFKEPQCIERTVGLEKIKKCYVIQEVKNEG